ncbi:phospholipase D-like domain-containing protein [Undibacterium flavidum]|uniref:Phospholipase D family protein n=1 Tax=Undibacterium flavidum TaxID=2762297 RepID=A0ABR6YDM8_9BURK|nr:phospholipase D family protein [Undibacterium flavidum]MBC3874650.1 phospholipase D family protein [Undibacterium flavidum]
MTPTNKLKLNLSIFCVLGVFWYLDRPFPNTSAIYSSVALPSSTSADANKAPQFALKQNDAEAKVSWSLPNYIQSITAAHPQQTGAYILENGFEALLARAWLADHATTSIEVQYFIWSNDNIGTLASEALIRAADRGVKVRVIVDDLLIEAEDVTLLALAKHPNVEIRIYNPKHRVGTNVGKRLWNIVADFKSANQRMHDKTFVVDGVVAITGGRNMASEYFNFHHEANFRDRDALILGKAVNEVRSNFDNFWQHPLSVPVEKIFAEHRFMQADVNVTDQEVQAIYDGLHRYANQDNNFDPLLKQAIRGIPDSFERLGKEMVWTDVDFIHDIPGKNRQDGLQGSGDSSRALAALVKSAQHEIVIQSPYLVLSDKAKALIKTTLQRGVKIIVNTNSLASTDNLQAFSGYRNQREELLNMGVEIFEFRPDAKSRGKLLNSPVIDKYQPAVFGLHAKSMVVDGKIAYIGTFNFDPRSENLNTEVGVIIHNPQLATQLANSIRQDMQAGNSWNAKSDDPDQHVSRTKRFQVWLLQLLPLRPIL